MRPILLLVSVFMATAALAQQSFDVVLMDATDAKGTRVQFRTDTKTLAGTSEWTPGAQEPPLTITAATKIAVEAGKRRLPKADDIALDSVTLRKNESYHSAGVGGLGRLVRWYYVFTVSPVLGGETFTGESATTIVVLLNGSVVEPSPVK